jgi:hypothetical protein
MLDHDEQNGFRIRMKPRHDERHGVYNEQHGSQGERERFQRRSRRAERRPSTTRNGTTSRSSTTSKTASQDERNDVRDEQNGLHYERNSVRSSTTSRRASTTSKTRAPQHVGGSNPYSWWILTGRSVDGTRSTERDTPRTQIVELDGLETNLKSQTSELCLHFSPLGLAIWCVWFASLRRTQ